MKLKICLFTVLMLVFFGQVVFAEAVPTPDPDMDNTMLKYQTKYDEIYQQFKNQLTPQQQFAGNFLHDSLHNVGDYVPKNVREKIENLDSLEKLQSFINEGYVCPTNMTEEKYPEAVTMARSVASKFGLEAPPYYYVEKSDTAPADGQVQPVWRVLFGVIVEGAEEVERNGPESQMEVMLYGLDMIPARMVLENTYSIPNWELILDKDASGKIY